MQVYKFGGASVKDADAVKNVVRILKENPGNDKVVVVSAMGKTTNALERVVNEYYAGDATWKETVAGIRQQHLGLISALHDAEDEVMLKSVSQLTDKVVQFLEQNESRNYNFIYDQVVPLGEYMSTSIISNYCQGQGLKNSLLDVKGCIRTDNAYTEGIVDWKETERSIKAIIPNLLEGGFVITQGFVGGTNEGFTTTLGREGSDYTGAIFSYCLNAEAMTVWKDVDGIMNADPRSYPKAELLPEISYREAIEMTYYGASVIHPKTIKPLQNKNIPMEVRSFLKSGSRGTVISADDRDTKLPPIIIMKKDQILLSFSSRDFSFIAEEHLVRVFGVMANHRLRINMMQNAAISFSTCVDAKWVKVNNVIQELMGEFDIRHNEHLSLLTIRHYDENIIATLTEAKEILLKQISRQTVQVLMREV